MKLRLMNDPVLRETTLPVEESEVADIAALVPDMILLMHEEGGIGLAANQVGISKRFFIMVDADTSVRLLINPEIIEVNNEKTITEGCLSIPGVNANVKRFDKVLVKFRDEHFIEQEISFTGVQAQCVQHEVDHLNGKLYIDRLALGDRMMVLKAYQNKKNNK